LRPRRQQLHHSSIRAHTSEPTGSVRSRFGDPHCHSRPPIVQYVAFKKTSDGKAWLRREEVDCLPRHRRGGAGQHFSRGRENKHPQGSPGGGVRRRPTVRCQRRGGDGGREDNARCSPTRRVEKGVTRARTAPAQQLAQVQQQLGESERQGRPDAASRLKQASGRPAGLSRPRKPAPEGPAAGSPAESLTNTTLRQCRMLALPSRRPTAPRPVHVRGGAAARRGAGNAHVVSNARRSRRRR